MTGPAVPRRERIEAQVRSSDHDWLRLSFFGLGAVFFGFAILQQLVDVATAFSTLILTLFLSWLFAFLVSPLVRALDSRLPSGRGLAVAVAYVAVIGAIALFVVAVAQIGAPEAADLAGRTDEISASLASLAGELQRIIGIDRSALDLAAIVDDLQRRTLPSVIQQLATETQTIARGVLSVFGSLFVIVVLSLYAVADPESFSGTVRRIVPNRHADSLQLVERTVGRSFRGFLRTQVALVVIQIGLTLIIGLVFGLPYLFLLTVSTAVLMFIPFFGPPLALVPVVFVALAFRSDVAVLAIGSMVIAQTVVVNAVQPRLLRQGVGLHPILVIVALLAGAQIAGIWGAIFGIPIVAIANLLIRYVIDVRAVAEVPGMVLEETVAEILADNPDVHLEDAVNIAADRAQAVAEAEQLDPEADRP